MEDYKSLWASWVSNHPNYVPSYHLDCKVESTIKYLEVVKHNCSNPKFTQEHARMFFESDLKRFKMLQVLQKKMEDKLFKEIADIDKLNKRYFVTINFNHQTWNVKDCVKAIKNVLEMSWVLKAQANFEFHRENGTHPHVHFFIETTECRSDVVYKLYRPQYIKKLIINKPSIDVKEWQGHHKDYMQFIKKEEKMPYVALDMEWRKQNGIEIYKKNGGIDDI